MRRDGCCHGTRRDGTKVMTRRLDGTACLISTTRREIARRDRLTTELTTRHDDGTNVARPLLTNYQFTDEISNDEITTDHELTFLTCGMDGLCQPIHFLC